VQLNRLLHPFRLSENEVPNTEEEDERERGRCGRPTLDTHYTDRPSLASNVHVRVPPRNRWYFRTPWSCSSPRRVFIVPCSYGKWKRGQLLK